MNYLWLCYLCMYTRTHKYARVGHGCWDDQNLTREDHAQKVMKLVRLSKIKLMHRGVRQLALEPELVMLQMQSSVEVRKPYRFLAGDLSISWQWQLLSIGASWNSSITIFVLAISLLPPRGFQCAAPTGIDENYKHQNDYVDNRNFPPVGFHILQQTSPTWIAIETQLGLVVAPSSAVGVRAPWSANPGCSIIKGKLAICRRLAASRLQNKRKTQIAIVSHVHL